jgi:hypothetical protein
MQRVVVIYYRSFGSTYRPHRKGSRIQKDLDLSPLKVGAIGCPKTSVRNYIYKNLYRNKSCKYPVKYRQVKHGLYTAWNKNNYYSSLRNNSQERSSRATFMYKAEGLGLCWYRGECDDTMRVFVGRSQGTGTMAGKQGVCSHCVSLDVTNWTLKFGGSLLVRLLCVHAQGCRTSQISKPQCEQSLNWKSENFIS